MHYRLEIIMPPTDKVKEVVDKIMLPFSEEAEHNKYGFWDFYVIGGRYAGSKFLESLDQSKLDSFYKWLNDEKVTVAGFVAGKQELSPASQIDFVDKKWNETFPSSDGKIKPCPLFKHSNDQYDNDDLITGDISLLQNISENTFCNRLIIATDEDFHAKYMIEKSIFNGVNYIDTNWDGKVLSAIQMYKDEMERCGDDYKDTNSPKSDWIVVTVDYHN